MRINEISTVDEEWYNPLTWFKKKPKATTKAVAKPEVKTVSPDLMPGDGLANQAANHIANNKNKKKKALDAFKKELGEGDMEADKKNPHAQPYLNTPEWKMLHDMDDKIIGAYVKHKSIARAAGRGLKKGLKKLSKIGSKHTSSSSDGTTNTTYGMANATEAEGDMNYDISQADTRVALDWARIDGRLYDDILQAFEDEHGEGYYDDWVITANKEGGVEENLVEEDEALKRLKHLINFRT